MLKRRESKLSNNQKLQALRYLKDGGYKGSYVAALKQLEDGGPPTKPITVSNPNHPRLVAYNDSLELFNGMADIDVTQRGIWNVASDDLDYLKDRYPNANLVDSDTGMDKKEALYYTNEEWEDAVKYPNSATVKADSSGMVRALDDNRALRHTSIAPIGVTLGDMNDPRNVGHGLVDVYKEPQVPVVYQANRPKVEIADINHRTLDLTAALPEILRPVEPKVSDIKSTGSGAGIRVNWEDGRIENYKKGTSAYQQFITTNKDDIQSIRKGR